MKKIVLDGLFGLENLNILDIDSENLRPEDVLVRAEAFSLNYLDVLVINGFFANDLPHVIGSDVSGTVLKVGRKVKALKPGDKVISQYNQDWIEGKIKKEYFYNRLGINSQGVFSENVVLPENSWVLAPKTLSFEESSTLPVAALTAWEALVNFGELNNRHTVLLQGSGGVSVFALQFVKAFGAKAIVISGSDKKLKFLRSLGADHTINYRNQDISEVINQLTNGNGVNLVLEVIGSNIENSINQASFDGKIALIGFLGGTNSSINIADIIAKNIQIKGIKIGSKISYVKMIKFIEEHDIKPVISKTFEFKEFKKAFNHMLNREHIGKVVLHGNWE